MVINLGSVVPRPDYEARTDDLYYRPGMQGLLGPPPGFDSEFTSSILGKEFLFVWWNEAIP